VGGGAKFLKWTERTVDLTKFEDFDEAGFPQYFQVLAGEMRVWA
jgi:hypothetical protein